MAVFVLENEGEKVYPMDVYELWIIFHYIGVLNNVVVMGFVFISRWIFITHKKDFITWLILGKVWLDEDFFSWNAFKID